MIEFLLLFAVRNKSNVFALYSYEWEKTCISITKMDDLLLLCWIRIFDMYETSCIHKYIDMDTSNRQATTQHTDISM